MPTSRVAKSSADERRRRLHRNPQRPFHVQPLGWSIGDAVAIFTDHSISSSSANLSPATTDILSHPSQKLIRTIIVFIGIRDMASRGSRKAGANETILKILPQHR
jgi:hypothetical protein